MSTNINTNISEHSLDPIEIFAEFAAEMYQQARFDRALDYFLALVRTQVPVTRLQCYIGSNDDSFFISLGASALKATQHLDSCRLDKILPYDLYEKFSSPCTVSPLIIEDLHLDEEVNPAWQGYEIHQSFLRLTLLYDEKTQCAAYISFWADTSQIFTPSIIDFLQKNSQPLTRVMRGHFPKYPDVLSVAASRNQSEAFPLIRMCKGLRSIQRQIEKVAPTKSTVLIEGETGVGKEVVAQAIHELSSSASKPFVCVNCGALSESLLDSLLFGHEKGSFTGAIATTQGYFEQANGGTLFLDEIGELPLSAQSRLLRVLEKKEIQRVGGTQNIPIQVRILAATNRDLKKMVEEKTFREDLWYRLKVYTIAVPPLRERGIDIILLANFFLNMKAAELQKEPPILSTETLMRLCDYPWHGNVRELSHTIERALINALEGETFGTIDFELEPINTKEQSDVIAERWPSIDDINNQYINKVLERTHGRIYGKNGAAEILGIHPNTLRSKISKLAKPSNK